VGAPVRRSDIARRRAACGAVALALVAIAAPAAAQVGPRIVSLYPVSRDLADATEVEGLLDTALRRLAQRTENVVLAAPLVVRGACGPARSAAPECLARLAGNGVVVRATLQRSGSAILVALQAVDGAGRSTGPVSTAIDTFIQTAEPLVNALSILLDDAIAGDRLGARKREPVGEAPPPRGAAEPKAPPPRAEEARPRAAPVEKPDLRAAEPPAKPAVAASLSPRPSQQHWMRTVGPWMTGAGTALLAGSLAVTLVNRSLSDDLEEKLAEGRLTAGDLSRYDRVELYNTVSKVLLASGGVLAFGGIAIWTAPLPHGPTVAGVAGRF
jgi:hypothetical protein